jgi:hypothetical protein
MISDKERQELIEDAHSPVIRKYYQNAQKKHLESANKKRNRYTLDWYFSFLNDYSILFYSGKESSKSRQNVINFDNFKL